MNNYTVYKHISPSGKVYIGITSKNPVKRWRGGSGYSTNPYFSKAIKKYGWENFRHEIICTEMTKEEAEAKEIELIAFFRSAEHDKGYNIQNGGSSNGKHSEETKAKIGRANKGRNQFMYGKHHSEEAKRKIAEHRIGTHLTEETKRKISIAHKGKKHSLEATEKRAKACQKKVICKELNKTFDSVKEAGEFAGVVPPSISACLKGKVKTSGGYHWEYVI